MKPKTIKVSSRGNTYHTVKLISLMFHRSSMHNWLLPPLLCLSITNICLLTKFYSCINSDNLLYARCCIKFLEHILTFTAM